MDHEVCLLGFSLGVLLRVAWGLARGEYRWWRS